MSELNNQKYLLTSQYNNAQKLKARIALHQRFSTNTYNWHRWIFDQFTLPAQSTLLELGCGPADLWCKNADRIPEQWQITLSDFSPGMLQEAQRNLQPLPHSFTLRHIDAQAITLLRNEIAMKGSIHISKDGGLFEARRTKG